MALLYFLEASFLLFFHHMLELSLYLDFSFANIHIGFSSQWSFLIVDLCSETSACAYDFCELLLPRPHQHQWTLQKTCYSLTFLADFSFSLKGIPSNFSSGWRLHFSWEFWILDTSYFFFKKELWLCVLAIYIFSPFEDLFTDIEKPLWNNDLDTTLHIFYYGPSLIRFSFMGNKLKIQAGAHGLLIK